MYKSQRKKEKLTVKDDAKTTGQQTTFTISHELWVRLKQAASKRGTTMSALIRPTLEQSITQFLDNLEPKDVNLLDRFQLVDEKHP